MCLPWSSVTTKLLCCAVLCCDVLCSTVMLFFLPHTCTTYQKGLSELLELDSAKSGLAYKDCPIQPDSCLATLHPCKHLHIVDPG